VWEQRTRDGRYMFYKNMYCALDPQRVQFDQSGDLTMRITFTTQQVVQGSGAPKRTVQNWISNGVLQPAERSSGSGTSNTFDWREIEVARLLVPFANRRMPVSELTSLAHSFREVIDLRYNGFIADNSDLKGYAIEMIDGGGPDLGSVGGGGKGMPSPNQKKLDERKRWETSTARTPEQDRMFWAYIAYGLSARRGLPAFWEVWFAGDDVKLHARLFNRSLNAPDASWGKYFVHGNPEGEFAGIVDLMVLYQRTAH
jgi:hypothetical protein